MAGLGSLIGGSRLDRLKELLGILADEIDQRPGARDLAQLARQYRETLKEIEEIEGTDSPDDEISRVLAEIEVDGQPRSVRENRSDVLRQRRNEGGEDPEGGRSDS